MHDVPSSTCVLHTSFGCELDFIALFLSKINFLSKVRIPIAMVIILVLMMFIDFCRITHTKCNLKQTSLTIVSTFTLKSHLIVWRYYVEILVLLSIVNSIDGNYDITPNLLHEKV